MAYYSLCHNYWFLDIRGRKDYQRKETYLQTNMEKKLMLNHLSIYVSDLWLVRFCISLYLAHIGTSQWCYLACFSATKTQHHTTSMNTKVFFYYPPSSGIASCVRNAGTVTWRLHLTTPCCVALRWINVCETEPFAPVLYFLTNLTHFFNHKIVKD